MRGWYVIVVLIITAGDGQQTDRGRRVQRCLSKTIYQAAMDANKCICINIINCIRYSKLRLLLGTHGCWEHMVATPHHHDPSGLTSAAMMSSTVAALSDR
jgi:hypothetical protein